MARKKCAGITYFCNNAGVRRMIGRKSNDPQFNCCMACVAYLRRMGVRLREVPEPIKAKGK